jgi:8-oxo-dGTP diphosphatase
VSNCRYNYEFPKADNTTDAVVFGVDLQEGTLKVLLIERGREKEPFFGFWALPGGFLDMKEDLDTCVRRELEEETGVRLSYMEQLATFGRPDRDPRGRVISTAYLALVRPQDLTVKAADDAAKARWFPTDELPALAFDHAEIVQVALWRLRSKVLWQPIGLELLPEEFTLTDLQQVYEIILGRLLDKRNFRRKVLRLGVLVPTGKIRKDGHHRPAKVYQFDRTTYHALQKKGINFEV